MLLCFPMRFNAVMKWLLGTETDCVGLPFPFTFPMSSPLLLTPFPTPFLSPQFAFPFTFPILSPVFWAPLFTPLSEPQLSVKYKTYFWIFFFVKCSIFCNHLLLWGQSCSERVRLSMKGHPCLVNNYSAVLVVNQWCGCMRVVSLNWCMRAVSE